MAEGRHFASDNNQNVQAPRPVVPKSRQGHNRPTRKSVDARRPRSNKPARKRIAPHVAVTCALAGALGIAGVAGVVAWLTAESNVQNQFVLGEVKPVVNEKGDGGDSFQNGDSVKSDINISNEGNVPIFVRVKVNCYYVDANESQVWEPAAVNGATGSRLGENWLKVESDASVNGTYLYKLPVEPQGETTALFTTGIADANADVTAEKGWKFICDISVQGIQADPARAVGEAWNVKVEDGAITGAANGQGA